MNVSSVSRVNRLLSCRDPNEPQIIGQLYGFGVLNGRGYEYPTGGSGFSFLIFY